MKKVPSTREGFDHDPERIERALKRAVRHALLQHKHAGNPIVVWRDGQIVWIPAEEIEVEEEEAEERNRIP